MLCQGTIINLSCMRLTESILINNWVERMVVGWSEVITRANLKNCKTGQENFTFAGKFHISNFQIFKFSNFQISYGCNKALLQIKINLGLNTSRCIGSSI